MKTVRSFANEEEEAEVYSRKLQQVYKLNRKEAAAYTYYVWGSGVCAPGLGKSDCWGAGHIDGGSLKQGVSLGPRMLVSGWLHLTSLCLSTGKSFWKRMHPLSECPHGAPPLPSHLGVGWQGKHLKWGNILGPEGSHLEASRTQPRLHCLAGPTSQPHIPH